MAAGADTTGRIMTDPITPAASSEEPGAPTVTPERADAPTGIPESAMLRFPDEPEVDAVVRRFGAARVLNMVPKLVAGGYIALTDTGRALLDAAMRIRSEPFGSQLDPADRPVAERLREWRAAKARERNVSAYVVMHNRVLFALAASRPKTALDLLRLGAPRKLVADCSEELLALAS